MDVCNIYFVKKFRIEEEEKVLIRLFIRRGQWKFLHLLDSDLGNNGNLILIGGLIKLNFVGNYAKGCCKNFLCREPWMI